MSTIVWSKLVCKRACETSRLKWGCNKPYISSIDGQIQRFGVDNGRRLDWNPVEKYNRLQFYVMHPLNLLPPTYITLWNKIKRSWIHDTPKDITGRCWAKWFWLFCSSTSQIVPQKIQQPVIIFFPNENLIGFNHEKNKTRIS